MAVRVANDLQFCCSQWKQSEQRLFLLPIGSSESYSLHVFVQLGVCDISKQGKYRRREMIRVVFANLKYAERYGYLL